MVADGFYAADGFYGSSILLVDSNVNRAHNFFSRADFFGSVNSTDRQHRQHLILVSFIIYNYFCCGAPHLNTLNWFNWSTWSGRLFLQLVHMVLVTHQTIN